MNCGIAAHETIRRYCNEKIRQRKERKMSVLEFIKVVILGIVEGITEWLPISSTGVFPCGDPAGRDSCGCCFVLEQIVAILHTGDFTEKT